MGRIGQPVILSQSAHQIGCRREIHAMAGREIQCLFTGEGPQRRADLLAFMNDGPRITGFHKVEIDLAHRQCFPTPIVDSPVTIPKCEAIPLLRRCRVP